MKIALPIFAIAAGVLAAQWLGAADSAINAGSGFRGEADRVAASQTSESKSSQASGSNVSATPTQARADIQATNQANPLLERAIGALAEATSVSARLRHRIQLFDQELIGSGLYEQQGQGGEFRLRFELKIQLGDKLASQLQVVDDRYLWTFQDTSAGPLVTQLDIKRVAAAEQKAYGQSALSNGAFVIGGLPKLLTGLRDNFAFVNVEAGHIGPTAVWALEGPWRAERLAALLPDQQALGTPGIPFDLATRPQIPKGVALFLTQDTLFPQRIEFHFQATGMPDGSSGELGSMVTLECLDVRFNEPIDVRQFVYQPGRQPVVDVTESYLQARGLAGSK